MHLFVVLGFFSVASVNLALEEDSFHPMIRSDLIEGDLRVVCLAQDYEAPDVLRAALRRDILRWPNGIIPYVIDRSTGFEDDYIDKIHAAMTHIEEKTGYCIYFEERTTQKDYIKIFKGVGCNSCVGRMGGEQLLSLGKHCDSIPVIIHELLHVVGLKHEQMRPDRDYYILVHWDNMNETSHGNFLQLLPRQVRCFTKFDMESIMLYGSRAFCKKDKKKPCITDLEGNLLPDVWDKKGMSKSDIKRVKILYHCDGEIDTMSHKLCQQKPKIYTSSMVQDQLM